MIYSDLLSIELFLFSYTHFPKSINIIIDILIIVVLDVEEDMTMC